MKEDDLKQKQPLDEKEQKRVEELGEVFFKIQEMLKTQHCFHWHTLISFDGSTLLFAQLEAIQKNITGAQGQLEKWDASHEQYETMKEFLENAQKASQEAEKWAKKMPKKSEGLEDLGGKLQSLQGLVNNSQNRLGSQLPSSVTGKEGDTPTLSRGEDITF
ncbi:MAG: hypothetical protein V1746_06275 [bacterium]